MRHFAKSRIVLGQDRGRRRALVIAVMNSRVSLIAGNFFNTWLPVNLTGRALLHWVSFSLAQN